MNPAQMRCTRYNIMWQTSRNGILEGRRTLDALGRTLLPLIPYPQPEKTTDLLQVTDTSIIY
jgi:hypothetical protein